jgi:hypothetical protein
MHIDFKTVAIFGREGEMFGGGFFNVCLKISFYIFRQINGHDASLTKC